MSIVITIEVPGKPTVIYETDQFVMAAEVADGHAVLHGAGGSEFKKAAAEMIIEAANEALAKERSLFEKIQKVAKLTGMDLNIVPGYKEALSLLKNLDEEQVKAKKATDVTADDFEQIMSRVRQLTKMHNLSLAMQAHKLQEEAGEISAAIIANSGLLANRMASANDIYMEYCDVLLNALSGLCILAQQSQLQMLPTLNMKLDKWENQLTGGKTNATTK